MAVKGAPVIIAENGIGLPVTAVTGNAPLVSVAPSGVPIVLVHEGGVPMIVDGGPGPGGVVPINTSPPTVTATAALINIEEDARPGLWQSDTAATFAYQWQISDDGEAWGDIDGAVLDVYTPEFSDRLKYIRVGVTATNATGSSDVVYSNTTAQIGPYDFEIYPGTYGSPSGDTGYAPGMMGSLLSPQPIPGHDIAAVYARPEGYGNISFTGDCLAVIDNLMLVIDPSPDPWGDQSEWAVANGSTQCIVSPAGSFDIAQPCTITWVEKP
jgi:hypothetical protein